MVRAASFGVPALALLNGLLGATRAMGTMTPQVTINQIFKPLAQIGLLLPIMLVAETPNPTLVGLAWSTPILVAALATLGSVVKLGGLSRTGEHVVSSSEFWNYTTPRAASVGLQTMLERFDVILIGALSSTAIAGVYGTLTRYIAAGNYLVFSVAQAISPTLRRAIAKQNWEKAQSILYRASSWMVLVTWPYFVFLAVKATGFLGLFANLETDGSTTLIILAIGMTINGFVGPVDLTLLMLGRSRRALGTTFFALATNVALGVVLIPKFGLEGAAIAWVAASVLQNFTNAFFVNQKSGLRPFGKEAVTAAVGAVLCFGIPGLLVGGQSFFGLILAGALGVGLYLFWCIKFADQLGISQWVDKALSIAGRGGASS